MKSKTERNIINILNLLHHFCSFIYSFIHSFMHVLHSMQDMAHLYPDRVITIQGGVDNLVQAEGCISSKLAECYEKDAQSANMVRLSLLLSLSFLCLLVHVFSCSFLSLLIDNSCFISTVTCDTVILCQQ